MYPSRRFGSFLVLALAALLMSRIPLAQSGSVPLPLAQSGSVPHLYLADGAWDSEDCRLVRIDDMTGKNWTAFAAPLTGPHQNRGLDYSMGTVWEEKS